LQGLQGPPGNFQGTQGVQGIQGIQGVQGILSNNQGTQGVQGTQGIQGTQGTQGLQGTQGRISSQGIQGLQGLLGAGTQGSVGSQGSQGPQGTQGLQGLQGNAGNSVKGDQGVQGTQATQGAQGTQGRQGTQGLQGRQGLQGTGTQGAFGQQGTQGLQNAQGTQGVQGFKGSGGVTSYAILDVSNISGIIYEGITLTTIGAYNTANSKSMSTTTVVPSTTPIAVFENSSQRIISISARVYLTTVSTLYYYINAADGTNWGESPDAGESIVLEYSYDGSTWETGSPLDTTDPTDLPGNTWTLKTVAVPAAVKYYSGVYLRLRQTNNSGSNLDFWAATSIIIDTGGSSTGGGGGGGSLAVLDVTSAGSLVNGGANLTIIADYNSTYSKTMSTLNDAVPSNTGIGVFYSTAAPRTLTTYSKVYLSNVETLKFYVNESDGTNWGEQPDSTEYLQVEYSLTGTSNWVGIHTVYPGGQKRNLWLSRKFKIPSGAQSFGGVYLRFNQSNASGTANDGWAFTSLLVESLRSDKSTSFAAIDFSSSGSVSNTVGTYLQTIGEYNSTYSPQTITTTTVVPSQTPICIFGDQPDNLSKREVVTVNKIYLTNVSTLYYYVNSGGSDGSYSWGEDPDVVNSEEIHLEYSYDGLTWQTGDRLDTVPVTLNENIWTLRTITVPTAAKYWSGVYLRFVQNANTGSQVDYWAVTSVLTSLGSGSGGSSNYASVSGIATYSATAGIATYAATAGIATYASTAGIATYASTAGIASVGIIDDTSTNATRYIGFSTVTSGLVTSFYTSSSKLTFNPSSGTLSATVFTSLSDQTRKTNIHLIQNPIGITQQLTGVRFNWLETNKASIGLIAQEVEKVIPEIVETNSEGIKSVNYDGIVSILIEAIKDQEVRIRNLERKIDA
jgi:hypothetical protein